MLVVIAGVTYAADFLSLCVMVHLLWPTQSYLYFNLKPLQTQIMHLDSLEFSGLTQMHSRDFSDVNSLISKAPNGGGGGESPTNDDDAASNYSELIQA